MICFILPLVGCQKSSVDEAVMDISLSDYSSSDSSSASQTSSSSSAHSGSFAVTATAAYVYDDNGTPTLYGAVEYENTSDTQLCLSEAVFEFSGKNIVTQSITPTLSAFDVIAPGERSYAALWLPSESFTPGETVELRVKLSAQKSQNEACALSVEDVFFADNYPGFTTMTGTLRNESGKSCSLNMVYAGFFDENDHFLGAWYFSQNARLDSGDQVRFTSHLKAFPLNQLAERGIHCNCHAFGFN